VLLLLQGTCQEAACRHCRLGEHSTTAFIISNCNRLYCSTCHRMSPLQLALTLVCAHQHPAGCLQAGPYQLQLASAALNY
jgi:hypothetical protein